MTLISLGNTDKIICLSSCFRIMDNPLHKSTHVGSGSLNTHSQVPSLFDLSANIYEEETSAPLGEIAAEHRLRWARNQLLHKWKRKGRQASQKPLLSLGCPNLTRMLRFTWMDSSPPSWPKSGYKASSRDTSTEQRATDPTLGQRAQVSSKVCRV